MENWGPLINIALVCIWSYWGMRCEAAISDFLLKVAAWKQSCSVQSVRPVSERQRMYVTQHKWASFGAQATPLLLAPEDFVVFRAHDRMTTMLASFRSRCMISVWQMEPKRLARETAGDFYRSSAELQQTVWNIDYIDSFSPRLFSIR